MFQGTDQVCCSFCGETLSVLENVRIRAKRREGNTWRCGRCNVHIVQLHREFGQWPTGGFAEKTQEAKMEFYKSIRNMGIGAIRAFVADTMASFEKHEDAYAEGGEFLPISVWTTRGFSGDDILENSRPENIISDPVLGTCYRVVVRSTFKQGQRGRERRQTENAHQKRSANNMLALADKPAEANLPGPSNPNAGTAVENANDPSKDSSDESSSSSDSSSSSRKQKKKRKAKKQKRKNHKKEKKKVEQMKKEAALRKEEAKAEAQAKKAAQAAQTANLKLATALTEKAADSKKGLDDIIGHVQFAALTPGLQLTAQTMHSRLVNLNSDVMKVTLGDLDHKIRGVENTAQAKALFADAKRKADALRHILDVSMRM